MRARIAWFALLAACATQPTEDVGIDVRDPMDAPPDAFLDLDPEDGVWMRGDLHLHSDHSDDAADNPMAAIVARAEAEGMDYFVVTDHDNHVDGMLTTWDDPAYRSDTMVMLYGVEWTTGVGHANFFGSERFDHAPLYALREGPTAAIADAAHAQGLHFSVNHPVGGDPWELTIEAGVDGIEVWNALWLVPNRNADAVALWDDLLGSGLHITARGGSDCHHQDNGEARTFNIGNPTTWILASERSAEAVIAGLNEGHATISYAPRGERLDFRADLDGDGHLETGVGDRVHTDGSVRFRVALVGFRAGARYEVTVIRGSAAGAVPLVSLTLDAPSVTFEETPSAGTYYRVEVRGGVPEAPDEGRVFFGDFVAMSNPIFFE